MLEMYLGILDDLIAKGEVKKGDAIIDETKETVIRPQKQHKKQNTFYQTVSHLVKRFSYT